jgi:hypothetical protein
MLHASLAQAKRSRLHLCRCRADPEKIAKGTDFKIGYGGKGANQAVAAASARESLIGSGALTSGLLQSWVPL